MPIPITSTAEWFRCIGPTATLQERQAALAKLVRMLCGDSSRPPSLISLAGRPAPPSAPPSATPSAVPPVERRSWRQALPRGKTATQPWTDADARDPYSREQLERMDARFAQRLQHAITHGQERSPCSSF
jgi:hypothetical protein